MPELEVSSGSFLSQIVALDLTIRPSKKSLAARRRRNPPAENERNQNPVPSSVWPNGQPPSPQGEGLKRGSKIPLRKNTK